MLPFCLFRFLTKGKASTSGIMYVCISSVLFEEGVFCRVDPIHESKLAEVCSQDEANADYNIGIFVRESPFLSEIRNGPFVDFT